MYTWYTADKTGERIIVQKFGFLKALAVMNLMMVKGPSKIAQIITP